MFNITAASESTCISAAVSSIQKHMTATRRSRRRLEKRPLIAMATRLWQASCSRGDKAGHSSSAHALTKHLVSPGFFRLRAIFFSTYRLPPA